MLTIITGTPGAGKSLYATWEEARKVPGSTIEAGNGNAVPRRLLTNIKNLLIEHQHIDAADLETWHEWAQPGDVIIFDEVQEVWRPRGLGTKVPECIAALETHRHKGVDIVLITQHPMLIDPNIRRLCNRHLHLRRLSRTIAYIYEWDHCANPGQYKTALQARVWFHPKKAYELYKSAQVHTKPVTRIPRLAYLAVVALVGLAYGGSNVYARFVERAQPATAKATPAPAAPSSHGQPPKAGSDGLPAPGSAALVSSSAIQPAEPQVLGCIALGPRCACFAPTGPKIDVPEAVCREGAHRVSHVMPVGPAGGMGLGPMMTPGGVPARSSQVDQSGDAPPRVSEGPPPRPDRGRDRGALTKEPTS